MLALSVVRSKMVGHIFSKVIVFFFIVVFTLSFVQIIFINPMEKENSAIHNLAWMLPTSSVEYQNELTNPQSIINRINGLDIDCLAVHGGWWKSDGTILYDSGASFSIWNNFINVMKNWNPNIKILVWVIGWNDTCDFRNSTLRTIMCNSAKQLLTEVPFDGWNEDYEGGSVYGVSYLLSFYNELSATLKNMGKIATVALEVEWGGYTINDVYPYLVGFDYVTPMFYSQIATGSATYYWNQILSNSSVPVLMGLAVAPEENGEMPLPQQFPWIDKQSKSNLAGFALWCYDYMTDSDFAAWGNWTTKDNISSLRTTTP